MRESHLNSGNKKEIPSNFVQSRETAARERKEKEIFFPIGNNWLMSKPKVVGAIMNVDSAYGNRRKPGTTDRSDERLGNQTVPYGTRPQSAARPPDFRITDSVDVVAARIRPVHKYRSDESVQGDAY